MVCADTDTIACVVHQQHVTALAVDDRIKETVFTSFSIAELDQLTRSEGSPVLSGPSESVVESAKHLLGDEECTSSNRGQEEKIDSIDDHDLNDKQQRQDTNVIRISSPSDQLQAVAEDEMKHPNTVEIIPNPSTFEVDSTTSQTVFPEETSSAEKPKLTARKSH